MLVESQASLLRSRLTIHHEQVSLERCTWLQIKAWITNETNFGEYLQCGTFEKCYEHNQASFDANPSISIRINLKWVRTCLKTWSEAEVACWTTIRLWATSSKAAIITQLYATSRTRRQMNASCCGNNLLRHRRVLCGRGSCLKRTNLKKFVHEKRLTQGCSREHTRHAREALKSTFWSSLGGETEKNLLKLNESRCHFSSNRSEYYLQVVWWIILIPYRI